MLCDKLNAYNADVYVPVYGSIAGAKVYLKTDVDEAISELKSKLAACHGGKGVDA